MNIFETSFDYPGRLEKLRTLMEEWGLDCMLVHLWPNQYYVSGFYHHLPWYPLSLDSSTECPLVLFRDRGQPPVFLCGWLVYNAVREGTWIEDVRAFDRESKLGPLEYLAKVLTEREVAAGRIGVEDECVTLHTFQKLRKALPKAEFVHASDIFWRARAVKDDDEIALIRKAVEIGEEAMKVGIQAARPGVTELEVQTAVELEMKRRGAIREVETMCQSGRRTANYRAFASCWKKIEPDDLVMVDLGCVYKGYACDITRTWVAGTPTPEQKKIAEDLYRAHEKILAFMKPGVRHRDVVQFTHEVLGEAGYPADNRVFPHRRFSFHGVGLGPFHDPPDNHHPDMVLEAGTVMSVQPSVRHEGYTIRFEDDVLVTPSGVEVMTKLPKEMI